MSKYYSECSECSIKTKSTLLGKEGFVCKNCYNKDKKIITIGDRRPRISLEKALDKTYEVKGYGSGKGKTPILHVLISCPQILIGHKVRLVLCDKETQFHGSGK